MSGRLIHFNDQDSFQAWKCEIGLRMVLSKKNMCGCATVLLYIAKNGQYLLFPSINILKGVVNPHVFSP